PLATLEQSQLERRPHRVQICSVRMEMAPRDSHTFQVLAQLVLNHLRTEQADCYSTHDNNTLLILNTVQCTSTQMEVHEQCSSTLDGLTQFPVCFDSPSVVHVC